MKGNHQPPKNREKKKGEGYDTDPREPRVPGRDAGDDSLANASPDDSRADEKVIVNEQRQDKIVNSPSDQPL